MARLAGLMLALAMPAALPGQDTTHVIPETRNVGVLHPGDALKIAVLGQEQLTGEFPIDARGVVQIAGLGEVQVGGLTPTEAKEELRKRLLQTGILAPEFAVEPVIRVAALGQVAVPGPHSVAPGTNLLQFLTVVGGATDRADLSKAHIIRDGRAFPVDVSSALEGSAAGRVVLYSNDVLVVPRNTGLFTRENLGLILTSTTAILAVANFVINVRR